jgi:hypothetical protein
MYGLSKPTRKTDIDGNLMWETSFGGEGDRAEGTWIEETTDGGYIVSLSAYINGEIWNLMKLDENGDSVWTARYHQGSSFCVQQTPDGGYITTGMYIGKVTLVKTDGDGEVLWSRYYDKKDNDGGFFVRQTSDEGYIITGIWGHKCSGGTCVQGATWLLKTDSNGDTVWTRTYGELGAGDYCWCVRETSDEGYILAGLTTTYGTGGQYLWLIKTDSEGRIAIDEKPVAETPSDWQLISSVGSQIVLRYEDRPNGFHAQVFDASGRKVDEIESQTQSGTLTWGENQNPGVYFIQTRSAGSTETRKAVIVK